MGKGDIEKIFSCTMCGFCCHGETTVSLNQKDQKRMVETLDLSVDEIREKYWRVRENVVQMKVVDGHCIFYDEGCSVHRGRPWRCREWPLHPSILEEEDNFETIRESCPGIKKDISYEEFCVILRTILDDDVMEINSLK